MYVHFESVNHETIHEIRQNEDEASPKKMYHGFAPKLWLMINCLS